MKKVLIYAATFDERVENYNRFVRALGGEPVFFIKTSELFADKERKAELVRSSDFGVVIGRLYGGITLLSQPGDGQEQT